RPVERRRPATAAARAVGPLPAAWAHPPLPRPGSVAPPSHRAVLRRLGEPGNSSAFSAPFVSLTASPTRGRTVAFTPATVPQMPPPSPPPPPSPAAATPPAAAAPRHHAPPAPHRVPPGPPPCAGAA